MRVLIAGVDGYLGWSLAQHLATKGHVVAGADAFMRRQWVDEIGSWSATPIVSMPQRLAAFKERYGRELLFWEGDLRDYDFVEQIFRTFEPEAVVQFAECPSAPYSMIDVRHATFVQTNNITTTFNLLFAMKDICPNAHLVKLGTMGEYGTPNIDIPEGFFEIEYQDRKDRLPFPRQAGSWYHWSKVHGSNNIMFACKIWQLKATDIMQGVVFGTRFDVMEDDKRLCTRFDFDHCFGTIINRYCAQAVIGHSLTPYGSGQQKRAFIPLRDSMQCLTLTLEHPPTKGEYRVFNQYENIYGLTDLAFKVQKIASKQFGLNVTIRHHENPRIEQENHYYNPMHQHLFDLGYVPSKDIEEDISAIIQDLLKYTGRIQVKQDMLLPDIHWNGQRRKVQPQNSIGQS